jgi:hypothetical protein
VTSSTAILLVYFVSLFRNAAVVAAPAG